MSSALPDPPTPPAGPPADPPAGDGLDLEGLIARLAQFDPADLEKRLGELDDKIANSAPVVAIRDALAPIFSGLDATLKQVLDYLRALPGAQPPGGPTPPAPAPAADPPPAPAPAAPAAAQPASGGVLDKLFSTPRV